MLLKILMLVCVIIKYYYRNNYRLRKKLIFVTKMGCLLLDKKGRNLIRVTKYIVIKNIKDTKTTFLNQMIFMLKKKMFLENINNWVRISLTY